MAMALAHSTPFFPLLPRLLAPQVSTKTGPRLSRSHHTLTAVGDKVRRGGGMEGRGGAPIAFWLDLESVLIFIFFGPFLTTFHVTDCSD